MIQPGLGWCAQAVDAMGFIAMQHSAFSGLQDDCQANFPEIFIVSSWRAPTMHGGPVCQAQRHRIMFAAITDETHKRAEHTAQATQATAGQIVASLLGRAIGEGGVWDGRKRGTMSGCPVSGCERQWVSQARGLIDVGFIAIRPVLGWNPVAFISPLAQIDQLAAFAAKWPVGVGQRPLHRAATLWARHYRRRARVEGDGHSLQKARVNGISPVAARERAE